MASARMTVTGLEAARNELRGIARKVRAAAPGAVSAGIEVILSEARQQAPVDTGELASTIEETKPRTYKGRTRAQVKTTARYGPAVDLGAEGRIGNDFMERTFDQKKNRAADVAADLIMRAIG